MFADDHRGWMPGVGGGSILIQDKNSSSFKTANASTNDINVDRRPSLDWICWQRKIDPISGLTTSGKNADANITFSGLSPYLGVKQIVHNSPEEANLVAQKLELVFRCPSDNLAQRPKMSVNDTNYRYSYLMNTNVGIQKPGNAAGTRGRERARRPSRRTTPRRCAPGAISAARSRPSSIQPTSSSMSMRRRNRLTTRCGSPVPTSG
jgi:hypothetical protein